MIDGVCVREVRQVHLDGNGHANNVKGIGVFFEDAKAGLLEDNGLGPEAMNERGLALYVTESSYYFLSPVFAGDNLLIRSSFRYSRGVRVFSVQQMKLREKVVARANATYAFVSTQTGKPVRPPEDLVEQLKV